MEARPRCNPQPSIPKQLLSLSSRSREMSGRLRRDGWEENRRGDQRSLFLRSSPSRRWCCVRVEAPLVREAPPAHKPTLLCAEVATHTTGGRRLCMSHHLRMESPLLHVAVIAHTTGDRGLCALHHLRTESPLLHVKVTAHTVGDCNCVYTRLSGINSW
ncbi:hypothetical protein GW17_00052368 [Ensete ventricosum]|nr:hypothetical protein GW17_00052368 [Ensete ventricosum]